MITKFESGQKSTINDSQFDFYGRLVACGTSDGYIQIFDTSVSETEKPALCCLFKGHSGPIWQVAWAHPRFGNLLATCGYDRKVIVWKEVKSNDWDRVKEFEFHKASVNSISWAPWEYGLILAAGSSDGCISLMSLTSPDKWDLTHFEAHKGGVTAVSFGPAQFENKEAGIRSEEIGQGITDESAAAASSLLLMPLKLASGGVDGNVKQWVMQNPDTKVFSEIPIFSHSDWVKDVAFCHQVEIASSVQLPFKRFETIASCSEDKTVMIHVKKGDKWSSVSLGEFKTVVCRLNWNVGGTMLGIATKEGVNYIYQETPEGKWEITKVINSNESAEKGSAGQGEENC